MASSEKVAELIQYSDIMGTDMVDIYVGPKRKYFHIHKDLICSKASYFEKMFSGPFKEGEEQAAYFPEDDADMFNLFVEWLYIDRFRPMDFSKNTATSGPIFDRIKLYCFAEKICLPSLQDYTISVIMTAYIKVIRFATPEVAKYVFENTPARSHLRAYMAHSMHHIIMAGPKEQWPMKNINRAMTDCPDLNLKVLSLIRNTGSGAAKNPHNFPLCSLHVHENNCRFPDNKSLGEV